MQEINLRNYAYLGDAVWELYIRGKTILKTNNAHNLHEITIQFVNTDFQSNLLQFLKPILTKEELELTRRARNLPIPVSRRSIQTKYRQATAFEALIGWLYKNNQNRYYELLSKIEEMITK